MQATSPVSSRRPVLFRALDRPWKVVICSVICSTLITLAMIYGVCDGQGVATALAIAIPTSGVVSALASVLIFRYVDQLAAKNEELRQINRELDAFAHTVAHDLKNPLTSVRGYAHLMLVQQDALPPDQWRTYLERVMLTSDKAMEMIDMLLLLASTRQEDVAVVPLDMAQIVRQAQDRLQFLIDQRQPTIHWPEQWPVAVGHAAWVEAVWANYLSNAIKYGGTPPQLEIGAVAQNGVARFWLADNGPGITPEDQAKLFVPFSQTQRLDGHGLGLSIARHAVERLGGEVGVTSQIGQGSTFYFTLPMTQ
ncbi:MAG: HAMP domain-containing histidine kinase [Anaerolineae bacterium]|nr:HAMP domain-containing histidine kinase [Anaerolineae bacterium]